MAPAGGIRAPPGTCSSFPSVTVKFFFKNWLEKYKQNKPWLCVYFTLFQGIRDGDL